MQPHRSKHPFTFSLILSLSVVFPIALFGIVYCSSPIASTDNGSGTGVGNGVIMGKVFYKNGTPAKGSSVVLRQQTFLADTSGKFFSTRTNTSANVTTSAEGIFIINSLDPTRSYSIEVNDEQKQEQATLYKCSFSTHDTIILTPRIMEPVIKINGTLMLSGLPKNAYIQIYGLERIGKSDSLGHFAITDLPVGKCEANECEYKLNVLIPLQDGTTKSVPYELEIKRDVNGNVILPIELEIDH